MFEVGETIAHNKLGLCEVQEVKKINDMDYYVLLSNRDDTKIMIPVSNADKLVRRLITREEIEDLVAKIPTINVSLIRDFKTRIKKYDELLKSGEIEKLAILARNIYEYKKEKNNLTVADREIFKMAEMLLFEELAFVLNMEQDDVGKYLFKNI